MNTLSPVAIATLLALQLPLGHAQDAPAPAADDKTLKTVTINASADASAQGLSPRYAGGQVARGGRAGILGTRDNLETPFSITAYTNELIQDRQAKSVGEVLQNDPSVRVARGFGNFEESYYIRGFIQSSDDVAYNGLYSLLPRQYIATELFERVEVLRGASAFLTGANPGGGGIGGAINLLPKRAPN
ncbi:MAG TPA: TonB-dependent receptor plug domain-containing protein, partial [Burkholderiaceae bacterium]